MNSRYLPSSLICAIYKAEHFLLKKVVTNNKFTFCPNGLLMFGLRGLLNIWEGGEAYLSEKANRLGSVWEYNELKEKNIQLIYFFLQFCWHNKLHNRAIIMTQSSLPYISLKIISIIVTFFMPAR